MKHSHPHLVRTLVLALVMLLISTTLMTRLAYLQIGQELQPQKQVDSVYTRTYTELASRGEILDRNGLPLVSNTLGYKVELDYYNWDRQAQNQVILTLCQILQEAGIPYEDNLPLTLQAPFAYTFAEDSREARALAKFVSEQEGWAENPIPSTLFTLLCEKYQVDTNLGIRAKRIIIGVRYYLESKQFSAYNNPVVLAADVDIDTVAAIWEHSRNLPGVTIQTVGKRQYDTTYAAHILGRVGAISPEEYAQLKDKGYKINDFLGTEGMEKALESYLRGVDGTKNVEVSRETGQVVQEYFLEEPQPGDHTYLTIDLELQKVAEDALAATLAQIKESGQRSKDGKGADVEGGALVVLDVRTGEILAMASYPTFNQSTYVQDLAANSAPGSLSPLWNRAVASAYPPGSTFKMVTAVAALESGLISPQTKIRDEGVFTKYTWPQPKCWIYNRNRGTHGNINVSQALAYSCNYFFYSVAYDMGIETLNKYAKALGLGQKTGVELSHEAAGNLDGPEARVGASQDWAWYEGITLSAAIGQAGQQLTPLQLANYVATIVNGGTRYQPHLLKEARDYTGESTVFTAQPIVLDQLELKDTTIAAVKEGMRGVVTDDGTASSYFRSFPMEVGGKTGSAETGNDKSANGVFVSFAPFENPEIVVVAIGEHAGSGGIMSPACIEVYRHYFNIPAEKPVEQQVELPVTEPQGQEPAPPTSSEQSAGEQPAQPAQTEETAGEEPLPPAEVSDPLPPEDSAGQEETALPQSGE